MGLPLHFYNFCNYKLDMASAANETDNGNEADKESAAVAVRIPEHELIKITTPRVKAELSSRGVHTSSKLRKNELLSKLRESLHLPTTKVVTVHKKNVGNESGGMTWNKDHPARQLLHNEIKEKNVPLDENEMGPAEVHCMCRDSMEFQGEGMECGATFVSRLRCLRKEIKKELQPASSIQWNESHPARKLLCEELASGRIPLDPKQMGPAEVFCAHSGTIEFQIDGMEHDNTFQTRLRGLRATVERDTKRAVKDANAPKKALRRHPPSALNHHGRPHWNGSEAQRLLREDIAAGKHKSVTPFELHSSTDRAACREALGPDDFRWKIKQEVRTKKHLCTLKHQADQKLRSTSKKEGALPSDDSKSDDDEDDENANTI